jgi:uncharacterized protein (TIGR03382 family)
MNEERDMKKTCVILAVAGMATAASAQTIGARFEVFDGANWGSSVNVLPGASVQVRMVIDWTGNAAGFGRTIVNGIRINGAGANGDSATGAARVAPFNFGAQNYTTYNTVANRLRIDVTGDAGDSTGGAISIFQNTPGASGTNFNTQRSIVVFSFTYNLAGANNALRSLSIVTGGARPNSPSLYGSLASTTTDVAATYSETAGTINVVPTPGSLALLGLGALTVGRRRRAR